MKIEFFLMGYGVGILPGLPMFYNNWQWWIIQAIGLCCVIGVFFVVRFITAHLAR